jgi:hypothetical protein
MRLESQYKIDNEVIKALSKFFEDTSNLYEKFQFVNRRTESCKTFSGLINIVPTETNEVEFREEIHQEKIDKKKETKMVITCKTRLKKTIQKKADQDDDESFAEKSFAGNSSFHDPSKKISLLNLASGNRNPALWIKIDPDNRYLKGVNSKLIEFS